MSSWTAIAQPWQSIAGDSTLQWNIVASNLFGNALDVVQQGSDTTLSGAVWWRIYSDYTVSNSQHLHGYIHDDISHGKLWYKRWIDDTTHLVYDINLVFGDSFYFDPEIAWPANAGWVLVDSVWTENSRKIIRFDSWTDWGEKVKFIEGIGPNMGIQYFADPLNTRPFLLCAENGQEMLYTHDNINFQECFLTSVDEFNTAATTLDVYPNPIQQGQSLYVAYDGEVITEYEIYSNRGQLVKAQGKTNHTNSYSNRLPEGIYLIIAHHNKMVLHKKIVVLP
jgi:hypothetical protein